MGHSCTRKQVQVRTPAHICSTQGIMVALCTRQSDSENYVGNKREQPSTRQRVTAVIRTYDPSGVLSGDNKSQASSV
jgi:hypothetical protein